MRDDTEMAQLEACCREARRLFNETWDKRQHPSFAARDALLKAAEITGVQHFGAFGHSTSVGGERGLCFLSMGDLNYPTAYVTSNPNSCKFHAGVIPTEPEKDVQAKRLLKADIDKILTQVRHRHDIFM
jgi:hypothetical protein